MERKSENMYRRFTFYIIPAIVLVLTFTIFLLRDGKLRSGSGEIFFSIPDTSKVNQISIIGEATVDLKRPEGKWILNDSLIPSPVAVDNLLFVFNRLKVKGIINEEFPVEEPERISIQIGGERRSVRKMFLISKNKSDFLQREGSGRIYPVEIPGFPDLRLHHVAVPDPYFWRDRLIFSFKPDDISSVEIHYPASPEKNFAIINAGNNYLLYNIQQNYFYTESSLNQEKLQMFSSYFMDVFIEDFIRDKKKADSILNVNPEMKIRIEGLRGDTIRICKWSVEKNGEKQRNMVYLRKNDEQEIMTASHLLVDLWSKDAEDFIDK